MHTTSTIATTKPRRASRRARTAVFVDCADPARRDLLTYWLAQDGYDVQDASLLPQRSSGYGANGAVLVTDRFGPEHLGAPTVAQLKEGRPGLRVVIVGHGRAFEDEELSLARAAGADGTLQAPPNRDQLLQLLNRWC
jgi:DNA-binding NtrC family response regulator